MAYTPIFTTLADVRRRAGFQNNANVTDDGDIAPKLQYAEGLVLSAVGQNYILPLSDNDNWTDSPAQVYIAELATELAALELQSNQYEGQEGVFDEVNDALKHIFDILDKLRSGKIKLFGSDQQELGKTDASISAISGFPNDEDNNPPKFKMNTLDTAPEVF